MLPSCEEKINAARGWGGRKKKHLLVSVGTEAGGLVVFGAVDVGAVVERAVPPAERPPTSLVLEMPMETSEGPMLLTLVLQKQRALLHSELFEIPTMKARFSFESGRVASGV